MRLLRFDDTRSLSPLSVGILGIQRCVCRDRAGRARWKRATYSCRRVHSTDEGSSVIANIFDTVERYPSLTPLGEVKFYLDRYAALLAKETVVSKA